MKLICIVGPTSSGKTALSLSIAEAVGGEIISADSRQVYRGLDIGSGKIAREEMRGIPHHLLDVADPADTFSAADFVRLGRLATYEVARRGRVPLVVGGTGFYIDALLGRISLVEVSPNADVRERLSKYGVEELQEELKRLDPARFETIDQKNPRRLIRAIEIAHYTEDGPLCEPDTEDRPLYDTLWMGLTLPRAELKKKIQARLSARLEAGMLEEAKRLYAEGLSFGRMEALGLEYRWMARHLQGKISYDDMALELEQEIARYAKRQMTWFKKNKDIEWFAPEEHDDILTRVRAFLKKS